MYVKKNDVVESIFHSFFKFLFDVNSNRDKFLVKTLQRMASDAGLTLSVSLPTESSGSTRSLILETNSMADMDLVNTFIHINELKEIPKTVAA